MVLWDLDRKPKLVIIEDDLDIAEILNAYFRVQGYEVFTVNRGEDGVRAAQAVLPDLVILDIGLPDIDGFEVARRLRSDINTHDAPIVFLTEKRERSDRLQGFEVGADDYITKPFDVQELRLRVRNIIKRRAAYLKMLQSNRLSVADFQEIERLKRPKIFISYSRNDNKLAEEIYSFLKDNECVPWMDTHDLVPGQDWKLEIHKNIKSCDYFIACLSINSVSKKGYVQKELKEAISVLDQVPEGQIYIIPIRLDNTPVPESLADKHWLDWHAPNAKDQLLKAIGKYL
jgi:DNA-binding response OmpR family regulator